MSDDETVTMTKGELRRLANQSFDEGAAAAWESVENFIAQMRTLAARATPAPTPAAGTERGEGS